jgi:hypothetical protein
MDPSLMMHPFRVFDLWPAHGCRSRAAFIVAIMPCVHRRAKHWRRPYDPNAHATLWHHDDQRARFNVGMTQDHAGAESRLCLSRKRSG